MDDKEVIYTGNGILDQIKTSDFEIKVDDSLFDYFYKIKRITVKLKDVGDYSLFIDKQLSKDAKRIKIKTKKSKEYISTDILSSPAGTLIYFKEPVKGIFKKDCIYGAKIYVDVNNFAEVYSGFLSKYIDNIKDGSIGMF